VFSVVRVLVNAPDPRAGSAGIEASTCP